MAGLLSFAAHVDVRRRDNIQASTSPAAYLMVRPILKNAGPLPSQRFLASDERDRPVRSTTRSSERRFTGLLPLEVETPGPAKAVSNARQRWSGPGVAVHVRTIQTNMARRGETQDRPIPARNCFAK